MQTTTREVILIRHGETEWSRDGRHTGRTDIPLTALGEEQARTLATALAHRTVAHLLVSPATRAWRTAQLADLNGAEVEPNLWEWDYGGYEGRTTAEIQLERPGWYLWTDGVVPGDTGHPGESIEQVSARVDAVLDRICAYKENGDVVVVAHGHVLRVLSARWLGLDPAAGRLFRLDTGTVSLLGTEHGRPVITAWNLPAPS